MRKISTHWALAGLVLSGAMFSSFGGPIVESAACTPGESAGPGTCPVGSSHFDFDNGSQESDTGGTFIQESGNLINTFGSNPFFPFSPFIIPADGPQEQQFSLSFGSSDALVHPELTPTSQETYGGEVPEPATYALIGVGLAALTLLRSRR